jgi:hypothetical protein
MVNKADLKPSLEISYKEFVAVLRKWDAFLRPELKKMPAGVPAISSEDSMQYPTTPDMEVLSSVKLSELAEALWRSLEAGAKEVDRIHDEAFAKEQVEFFVGVYSSENELVRADGIYGMLMSSHPTVDHPAEFLMKLGRPAQVIIVREGHLAKAVEVYERARGTIAQKLYEESEAEEERRREARERRASPDYVRLISGPTRQRVRELDKNQCVFCGAEVGESHGKYSYVRLTPKGYKEADVVLSCKPCEVKLGGKTPAEAGMPTAFGRFTPGPPE